MWEKLLENSDGNDSVGSEKSKVVGEREKEREI